MNSPTKLLRVYTGATPPGGVEADLVRLILLALASRNAGESLSNPVDETVRQLNALTAESHSSLGTQFIAQFFNSERERFAR